MAPVRLAGDRGGPGAEMKGGRGDVEAGETVEKELDAFIERRARDTRKTGKDEALEEMWRASEQRDRERRRRKNRALWYEFHVRLADAHAAISREHEERALALLEEPEPELTKTTPCKAGDPMHVPGTLMSDVNPHA